MCTDHFNFYQYFVLPTWLFFSPGLSQKDSKAMVSFTEDIELLIYLFFYTKLGECLYVRDHVPF